MCSATAPSRRAIGFAEFIVLIAAMMWTQSIALDAMLPALPTILRALKVTDPNRGQWIVMAYLAGMGLGQLFWGSLSDRYGRRPVLLAGLGLYALASFASGASGSFVVLLGWRLVHGLAAASVVVGRSVIRDLYSGRRMARVMSLTFIVFIIVPIIAPTVGQMILLVAPWRFIFTVFGLFALAIALWTFMRLPETLHPEYRMTLSTRHLVTAARLVAGNRASWAYTAASTAILGFVYAYIGMVQQVFGEVFHRVDLMPRLFALCAFGMGLAAFLNSSIVERIGMRVISQAALLLLILIAAAHVVVVKAGLESIWTFVALQALALACVSLTLPNFGAMALEPLGSVAGIGASLQGCAATFGGAIVGALIGAQFHGSTMPLAAGALLCGVGSLLFVLAAEHGRLFRPQHVATAEQAIIQ